MLDLLRVFTGEQKESRAAEATLLLMDKRIPLQRAVTCRQLSKIKLSRYRSLIVEVFYHELWVIEFLG